MSKKGMVRIGASGLRVVTQTFEEGMLTKLVLASQESIMKLDLQAYGGGGRWK